MKVSNTHNTFKGISSLATPLNLFYNQNAILPTLVIESGVTTGRSAVAAKRGGKMEASERLVEQGVSAIVWLFGVQTLKKIGDSIGKKFFNLDLNFDVGFDYLRNPLKNNKNISNFAKSFKIGNILVSTAIATYFIGFVLPKINHKISEQFIEKSNNSNKNSKYENLTKPLSFNEFTNSAKQKNHDISFTSISALSLAHSLENNQTSRLLLTDMGVVSGRYKNSRNKYEKIESLFRDISSIYFYLFSTKHFVKLMNKLTGNTDIDPVTLECLKKELTLQTNKAGDFSADILKEKGLGTVKSEDLEKLKELFKDGKKVVSVDDFIKHFANLKEKAINMSKLQPIFDNKGMLSYTEAKDVLNSGWISNPEFLKKTFEQVTEGKSSSSTKFVSAKSLEEIRNSMDKFVTQIVDYAKKYNVNIDEKLVDKIANGNIRKNFAFYLTGTAISIFVLSYLIPKIQYFITAKLTNQDKFPGACKY